MAESEATPEEVYMDRRRFLKLMGLSTVTSALLLAGCDETVSPGGSRETGSSPDGLDPAKVTAAEPYMETPTANLYPARWNDKYRLDRPTTDEHTAASFNNFYEFSDEKEGILQLMNRFRRRPWQVEVGGLMRNPRVLDIDDLVRLFDLEERLYRFRCVEAWSMSVPWTGIPMGEFIKKMDPDPSAKYVKMTTFLDKEVAPGQKKFWYPWPYVEALTMAEATNELTMLVTGIYGHELPKQHGAPVRLIVPWKYGFKSIKSIVRIEFTAKRPDTFWNTMSPREYDFEANVNPGVPHPRWSQATEKVLGTGKRVKTLLYNGYGESVAHLYQ